MYLTFLLDFLVVVVVLVLVNHYNPDGIAIICNDLFLYLIPNPNIYTS